MSLEGLPSPSSIKYLNIYSRSRKCYVFGANGKQDISLLPKTYEGIKVNRLFQYRIAMSKPGGGTG